VSGSGARLRTLAVTIASGAVGGAVFAWLNTPLPWMLGALFATIGLAIAGVPLYLPSWLRRIMIAVLGVMLGSAFTPDVLGHVLHWWPTLVGLTVFIAIGTSLISWFYQRFGDFDKMTAFFAASPGGLSEMVVLGPMMGGDVRQITLAHATRIVLVVMIIPPLYRLFAH
jgi:membrane AbrB-like protein